MSQPLEAADAGDALPMTVNARESHTTVIAAPMSA
jgi:hypothetical protein